MEPSFWPQDAEGWATFLTLTLLLVGAWLAYQQLRQAVTTRHAALMVDLSRRWDDPLLARSRRLAAGYTPDRLQRRLEYLIQQNLPDADVLLRNPNLLEDLAVLEQSGAIPFDMIRRSLGGTIVLEWSHWEPTIRWMRGDERYDLVYENWESLAERMRTELAKHDEPGA